MPDDSIHTDKINEICEKDSFYKIKEKVISLSISSVVQKSVRKKVLIT